MTGKLTLSEITLSRLDALKKAQIKFNATPNAINFEELKQRMLDYQDSYAYDFQQKEKLKSGEN